MFSTLKQWLAQNYLLYLRGRHFILIDVVLISLSYFLSYVFRFDLGKYHDYYSRYSLLTLVILVIRLPVFYWFGLYRRLWRYASIKELFEIIFSVSSGSGVLLLFFIAALIWEASPNVVAFPRSIFALEWMLTLLLVGGSRFALRVLNESWQLPPRTAFDAKKTLIIGAGDAGATLAREMQTSSHVRLIPVGFIDDDPLKIGRQIRGVRVLGTRENLATVAKQTDAQVAVIAMPSVAGKVIRETVEHCRAVGLEARIIPGIYELLDGRVTTRRLRNVQLNDLLRRESHATDLNFVATYLTKQRVLITGAGGSIGSELCRQIARAAPSRLILLGHGENSIFEIHNELNKRYPQIDLVPVIADVRDHDRLLKIFEAHNPQAVFHAAAHKHVPLMETNPGEAITNNVIGTANILAACEAAKVKRFVLVSTDKAVRPTNIMGLSKRFAELLVIAAAQRTQQAYVAVRFGNVLGSRGSVVPIFENQIAQGGPITITHPEIKRFFMTIPEAARLIMRAGSLGNGGEIFVLDMGEQIRIVDLATDLLRLSGLESGSDIEIVFTGLRLGEKMEEELFAPNETYRRTDDERIFVITNQKPLDLSQLGLCVNELTAVSNHNQTNLLEEAQTILGKITAS